MRDSFPAYVTVLTPAVAQAKGYIPPNPAQFGEWGAYVVAAPDGLYYGPTFAWAKEFAASYGLPVSYL